MNEIESMVAKLQVLAAKPALTAAENAEAQAAMQTLKAKGMSNEEISKASQGRWSVSTVKGYTTGIGAPSPSPWQNAVSLLTDLIAANLSLDDVKVGLAVNHTLAAHQLTPEQVIKFLKTVAAASLDPVYLISEVKVLQQSGLSLQAAAGVIALKEKMEGYGLTLEALPALTKIAQQHGSLPAILEAFSVYTSLAGLQTEVAAAQEELKKIQAQAAAAGQQLAQTEAKYQQLQAPLEACQKVQEQGFSQKELSALSELSAGYGGPEAVIQAVKEYTALEDIKSQLNTAKAELASCESKVSRTMAKRGHLTSAIKMCETLIADHELGLDALGTILEAVEKFGQPIAVIKAIEKYGQMEILETVAKELSGTVTEREKLLEELEAQFKEAREKLNDLCAVVLQVGNEAGRIEGQFQAYNQYRKLLDIMNDPGKTTYAEHGQIVMLLAISLSQWVARNETSFKSVALIKGGLQALAKELGGLP